MKAYDMVFHNLTVLECGSYENGGETEHFRENNDCYYMDAVESHILSLKTIPGIVKENVFYSALTDYDGTIDFTITSHPGNSSLRYCPEHRQELENIGASFQNIKVPCITYKTFQEKINKIIDILILDIEGGELNVLTSWKELSIDKLPKILCIEAGYDWEIRKKLLLDLGYVIDFYSYNNVILHHSSFTVKKNEEYIRQINLTNPKFIYNGKIIFVNDCL